MLSRIPTILLGIYIVNSVLASHRLPSKFQPPTMPLLPGMTPSHQQQAGKLMGVEIKGGPRLVEIFAPRRFHLRKKKLLKKLGENFDPDWMSIEQPPDFFNVSIENEKDDELANEWIRSANPLRLMKSLTDLNITRYSNQHEYNRRHVDATVRKVMSVLQDWLVKKATCPVIYIWEDMGNLFWPRYIRKGYCSKNNIPDQIVSRVQSSLGNSRIREKDCSWPPGMFCVSGEEKRLRMFSWKCQPSRAAKKRKNKPRSSPDSRSESEPGLRSNQPELGGTTRVGGTKGSFQRTLESVGSGRRFAAVGGSAGQGQRSTRLTTEKEEVVGTSQQEEEEEEQVSSDGHALNAILSKIKSSRQKRSHIIPEEMIGYIGSHSSLPQGDAPNAESRNEPQLHEDYSHLSWRELKKKFKVKCRFQKITFPVTQYCHCSC
ncbi:noggin [Elysia marginata]|uniref:Noggin n=1 Tax=Elysia marginata TaxID=1093978 RepID=A0AAV4HQ40_9GAST|nr:noggin [Elysia marginata]